MNTTLLFLIIFEILSQKYRVILPSTPPQPPALNNTVQAQIANQNINFNTGSSISGGGGFGGGGFQQNTGGIQGTAQYTQNNAPGIQISQLYQLPIATQYQQGGFGQGGGGFGQGGGGFGQGGGGFGQGGGGFGQGGGNITMSGGFGQGGGGFGQSGGVQAIGMNNPFYQMAMQGIMSGVGGSAFQSGGGGNMGGQNMRGIQFGGGNMGGGFGQFSGGFGQFGGGFNNGGNGL